MAGGVDGGRMRSRWRQRAGRGVVVTLLPIGVAARRATWRRRRPASQRRTARRWSRRPRRSRTSRPGRRQASARSSTASPDRRGAGGDRHAEHRHGGLRGQHAGQVRGAACAGDDRPQPALPRQLRRRRTSRRACGAPTAPARVARCRTTAAPRPPCPSSTSRWSIPSPRRPAGSRSPAQYVIGRCARRNTRRRAGAFALDHGRMGAARRDAIADPFTLTPAAFRSWYSHSTGLGGTASTNQSECRVTLVRSGGATASARCRPVPCPSAPGRSTARCPSRRHASTSSPCRA